MSQTITINGSDLNYFKDVVGQALSGDLGRVDAVTVTVDDRGQLTFGVNGYVSQRIGERVDTRTTEQVMGDLQARDVRPEGSGNPYANVSDQDSPENRENLSDADRLRLAEHDITWLKQVVSRAEGLLGVRLRGESVT